MWLNFVKVKSVKMPGPWLYFGYEETFDYKELCEEE
jgi:hypothetical protein